MAQLGIDFGTTNTVVVCSDRGRYPIVPHVAETAIGHVVRDVFPSLLAYDHDSGRFLYGPDAERCLLRAPGAARYSIVRSIKRLLRDYVGGGRIGLETYPGGWETAAVLTGFAAALRDSILRAGLFAPAERLRTVLTWPAHANGAQRYVTRACFKAAGFEIVGTLNEPTAAAIEFADRMAQGNRMAARKLAASVAIFDFGGGTFDASLVRVEGGEFTVLDAAGIEELGGDDLDQALAFMFAEQIGVSLDALPPLQRDLLLRHACQQKESIASGAVRTLTLVPSDIGVRGPTCTVPVAAYFERVRPVIAPAVDKLWSLVAGSAARAAGIDPERLDTVYLVGGSSKLPLVAQLIAARFPAVRLVMTDKPFTATAMGAAIHSAEGIALHDILSRHFGVIRLADRGTREYFAPIFRAGTQLPPHGGAAVEARAEYAPQHNVGHLRYFECAGVDERGQPALGVRAWSDVLFPYDPNIPVEQRLTLADIVQRGDLADQRICEVYSCDSDGVITVRMSRRADGQARVYEIFRD
ncbi:MAG TPA: Hsp70 family protein [Candidatus Margulisiibacteriota bacterium]|nr:Hsp70 family protein [Candidatus Margulisiibacteriota bacterium]